MTNINDYNRAELKKICNIHNKNLMFELKDFFEDIDFSPIPELSTPLQPSPEL